MCPLAAFVNAAGNALAATKCIPLMDVWIAAVHLGAVSDPDWTCSTATNTAHSSAASEASPSCHSPSSHLILLS